MTTILIQNNIIIQMKSKFTICKEIFDIHQCSFLGFSNFSKCVPFLVESGANKGPLPIFSQPFFTNSNQKSRMINYQKDLDPIPKKFKRNSVYILYFLIKNKLYISISATYSVWKPVFLSNSINNKTENSVIALAFFEYQPIF